LILLINLQIIYRFLDSQNIRQNYLLIEYLLVKRCQGATYFSPLSTFIAFFRVPHRDIIKEQLFLSRNTNYLKILIRT